MSIDLFVPDSHRSCTLDNFDFVGKPTLKSTVYDFLAGKLDHGLLLYGDPGIGKTHLLVSMFRELVEKQGKVVGQDVFYMTWSDTLVEIFNPVSERGGIPESVAQRITAYKILIIDDIRPGFGGRIWNDFLKRIIEQVYDRGTKLLVSTNVESPDDLVAKWQIEDYWLSRMKDCLAFVAVKGEDRRGIKRSKKNV